MVASKTRVWRGGLAEIMRTSQPAQESADAPAETKACVPAPLPLRESMPRTESSALRNSSRSQHATLVGHVIDLRALDEPARSKALSTTRVVPIESLLAASPEISADESDAHAPATHDEAGVAARLRPKLRLNMMHARRAMMALLALFVLGTWSLRSRESASPSKPASATAAQRTRLAPTSASAPTLQPAAATTPVGAALHPRSAVDALASGDYVAAQRLYVELAKQVEGRSAYAEAARILEERLQSKSEQ